MSNEESIAERERRLAKAKFNNLVANAKEVHEQAEKDKENPPQFPSKKK